METIRKNYMGSMIFTIIAMAIGFLYGMQSTGSVELALQMVFLIFVLGALEVSLSFDNAVANAKVLNTMSPEWQHRFITWGMVIAVFGMRVILPVLIVYATSNAGLFEIIDTAIHDSKKYGEMLHESEFAIMGFGASFLSLVFFAFFFDAEKETHWIKPIERQLVKLGRLSSMSMAIAMLISGIMSFYVPEEKQVTFLIASGLGIMIHQLMESLGESMENTDLTVSVTKAGLSSFIYLELLDMSFSLDGVIGAFVVTSNIVVIGLGLGIGALFVRSMTLHLVHSGKLAEYRYLEHGAFWAIGILVAIMYAKPFIEIPEYVTGLLSIGVILLAVGSSISYNKKEESL